MNRLTISVLGAACVLLLTASRAPAGAFTFQYDWSQSTSFVGAGGAATGSVLFASPPATSTHDGSGSILAATITASSIATVAAPDTYTGQKYTMTAIITDVTSGQKGTFSFTGHLFGTLTGQGGSVSSTFDQPLTETMNLGGNKYTVTIGPFIGLNYHVNPSTLLPTPGSVGSVNAFVKVEALTSSVPEPSTLALAALGIGGLFGARRRRQ